MGQGIVFNVEGGLLGYLELRRVGANECVQEIGFSVERTF